MLIAYSYVLRQFKSFTGVTGHLQVLTAYPGILAKLGDFVENSLRVISIDEWGKRHPGCSSTHNCTIIYSKGIIN